MSLAEAFGNTDASISLVYGGFAALLVALLLYIPRDVLSFRGFMDSITEGVQSMTGAIIILTLAWTISGVCRDLIGTGEYVGEVVRNSTLSMTFIPAIIFAVAAFLSFSMGTAWGTFGILIPIVHSIIGGNSMDLLIISFAATFAGSVFGDHCSPISDTTILSSTGADCPHINHVSSLRLRCSRLLLCGIYRSRLDHPYGHDDQWDNHPRRIVTATGRYYDHPPQAFF